MDMVSIRMLKTYGDSVCTPLEMILSRLSLLVFQPEWKKRNIVPTYKKGATENYRPVSFLPICGKIFERLISKKYFTISPLINPYLTTTLVSSPVIPASTNYHQLPTKLLYLLILD